MNFERMHLMLIAIVIWLIFYFLRRRVLKKYLGYIRKYFFYELRKRVKLALLFHNIAFILLFVAMLDLKGPEESVKAQIPDQQTILLIDSSASMLVEDVRPNRYKKALLLARHFIKESAAHQIAVVAFSDTQRKIVPFTDDIEVLDARVSSLENVNISNGGSNIEMALKESVQYFVEVQGKKEVRGNIVLFTDAEKNEEHNLGQLPRGISLAVVGVGTAQGGKIPMRNKRGQFQGYKKYQGNEVVSKLDEESLRSLADNVSSFKYWIARSYTLPTEEILSFFRSIHNEAFKSGRMRYKPSRYYYLIVPAMILFIVGFILRMGKWFIYLMLLIPFGFHVELKAEEPPYDKKFEEVFEKVKRGESNDQEKLVLASKFLERKEISKAIDLYDELRNANVKFGNEDQFNYATGLLQNKRIAEAIQIFESIIDDPNAGEKLKELSRSNLINAKKKQEQQKKKKQDQKNDDQKEQKGDQKKNKEGDKGKQKKNQDNKQGQKKDNKDKNQQKKSSDEKKKEQGNKKNNQKDKKKSEEQKPQSIKDKERQVRKKRREQKVPAVIKNIMSSDREQQNRMFKTSTSQGGQYDKKDW